MDGHIFISAEMGKELREARKNKGYRQEDIVVEQFISTGTISRMERGGVQVSRCKWEYLCEKLGIELEPAEPSLAGTADEVDLSLQLLSIENQLNMVSVDDAWQELRKLTPKETIDKTWVTYLKGRYYEKKGKKQQAKTCYLQVTEVDDLELKMSNFIPASYHALGRIHFYEDQLEEALRYVEKGLSSFVEEGERTYILHFLQISQVIYLEKLNRNEEALILLEKLWDKRGEIESREVLLNIYEMKARLFTKLSQYEQAIKIATEGLSTAQLNRMYDYAGGLWLALGECYSEQGKLQNAEICFQSALNMVDKMKNVYIVNQTYLKMGMLYLQREAFPQAHTMFCKAVQSARDNKDAVRLVEALCTLGDFFLQQEKLVSAKESFQEALIICEAQLSPKLTGNLLMRLAKCCCNGDKKEYYQYLDKYYLLYNTEPSLGKI